MQLVFLIGYTGAILYAINRSVKQEKVPKISQPAAIAAIEDSIGRCVEMRRPMLFQTGIGDVSRNGAIHMAMLSVLDYTARLAAQKDAKLIVTTPSPTLYPMAEGIVREAYALEGKQEAYTSDMVQFLSNNQMAYCSAVMHLMRAQNIAFNVQIGFFQAENLITLEAAKETGAVNIGGAVRTFRIPGMAFGCDYFLMGEEVFAAGAFCSNDPLQLGSLSGQDLCKMIAVLVIVLGALFSIIGNNLITFLLGV
jgi:hypothetical protein